MEEVLDVYTLPEDPAYPLVCMDEASKQLVGETRTPLPVRPGDIAHYDYEYVRNGVANLWLRQDSESEVVESELVGYPFPFMEVC